MSNDMITWSKLDYCNISFILVSICILLILSKIMIDLQDIGRRCTQHCIVSNSCLSNWCIIFCRLLNDFLYVDFNFKRNIFVQSRIVQVSHSGNVQYSNLDSLMEICCRFFFCFLKFCFIFHL